MDAEAAELDALINKAIETKSYNGLDDIQDRLDKLAGVLKRAHGMPRQPPLLPP